MSSENSRTPLRLLILGCTSFAGFDSVRWENALDPNIPDYDVVVVSVPHITEKFLKSVDHEYFRNLRKSLIRFMHSKGKMVVLASAEFHVRRPKKIPVRVSNISWCPIDFATIEETGKSIVRKQEKYSTYLNKMSDWSFYLTMPSGCLTDELTNFYGGTYNTKYLVRLESYIENRYGRVLAGEFHVEVRSDNEPESGKISTGRIVLLPLIDRISPEEALAEIIQEEVGVALSSPEPDWALSLEMPRVPELLSEVEAAQVQIASETEKVERLNAEIAEINSFRRLLFSTGSELEAIVKRSLEQLGATVSPSRHAEEEYILEFHGEEFLMEVKGVAKSISLTHLRQLNDYLLRYQEDTGKECRGILFGNAWRNTPPELRGKGDTPEFPDNVVRRAEQLGISLVSAKSFFEAFVTTLEAPQLSNDLLVALTRSSGVAFPSSEPGATG